MAFNHRSCTRHKPQSNHNRAKPADGRSSDINTLRPRPNGRRFADDTFKRIFLNENVRISIKISLKFVLKGPISNNPALVQIMAWRRPGDKPLSEPMIVSLLTHICVTRPQSVNVLSQVLKWYAGNYGTLKWHLFWNCWSLSLNKFLISLTN